MALTYSESLTQFGRALLGYILLVDWAADEWFGARDQVREDAIGDFGVNVRNALAASQSTLGEVVGPAHLQRVVEATLFDLAASEAALPGDELTQLYFAFWDYFSGTGRASAAISGITKASTGVVTSAGHGLPNGARVWIDTPAGMTQLNRRSFAVANRTDDTFELGGENTSGHSDFTSGRWTRVDAVESRELTYGSVTAGATNVGTGLLRILSQDHYGYPLESCHIESKVAVCIRDGAQVQTHSEVFQISGENAQPDGLRRIGSGAAAQTLTGLTTINAESFLANPSLSSIGGTAPTAGSPVAVAAVNTITGWTLATISGATLDADVTYRNLPGETRRFSLRFAANNKLSQIVGASRRAQFLAFIAYWRQVAVYREGNCDGTLTLKWGRVTVTVAMTSLSNGAWNLVTAALDRDLYGVNFTETNMEVSLELSGRTTGSIYIQDWTCGAMIPIDGRPAALIGGATPFRLRDRFTAGVTQSDATKGRINEMLWRAGLPSLPAVTSGATLADPALPV